MTLLWTKGTLHHAVKGLHLWGNVSWIPISPTSTFSLSLPSLVSNQHFIPYPNSTGHSCVLFLAEKSFFYKAFCSWQIFFGRKLAISLYFISLNQCIFSLPPSLPPSLCLNLLTTQITSEQQTREGKNTIGPHWGFLSFFFFSFFFLVKLQQVEMLGQSQDCFFS